MLILAGPIAVGAETGTLDLTVFSEGGTLPNQEIVIKDVGPKKTNADGQVNLDLTEGNHELSLSYGGELAKQDFKIVGGQVTVITINVAKEYSPRFSVENPATLVTADAQTSFTEQETVELKGKVVSFTDKTPVKGAQVYVRGFQVSAQTNEEGEFAFSIPVGNYSLSIIHPKFSTLTVDNFDLPAGGKSHVFPISPAGIKMDEFVVTAPHIKGSLASLMDERRLSAEVVDVLGSEQISKSGDGDAASAIKRVTGLTLKGGKYPFIRGMGGRYVTTQLNGFNLPSPDPSKRVVPLDMFPTGILEGISVVKSSSADRLGEFGGGHILLKTKSLPDEFTLKFSSSAGVTAGSQDALMYEGGDQDWLGFDDGTRELPAELALATSGNKQLSEKTITNPKGLTPEELELLGESFNDTYNVEETSLPISRGFSASIGDSYELWDFLKFGAMGSIIYGDDWETTRKKKAEYNAADSIDPKYETLETERLVKAGLSGSLGIDLGEHHQIRSFSSLLRRTTDETEFRYGTKEDWDGPFQQYFLKWQEREMVLQQVWGRHTLPFLSDFTIDWRIGSANAYLYQPDTREYRYEINNDTWEFSSRKGGNKRNFTELNDTNEERGVDFTLPVKISDNFDFKVKAGAMQIDRSREGKTRRFGFGLKGTDIGPDILQGDLESILSLDNIDPNGFVLKEITQSSDTYRGLQIIDASYGLMETNLFETVSLSAGARFESSQQYVKTFYLFDPDNEPAIARLDKEYILPSFNSTVKVGGQSQVRFSYNTSLARPDFRELSPTPFIDDETGDEVVGNPDLLTTEIEGYDTRFEWYGHANESVSIAAFYKKLKNPIEISIIPGTFQKRYELAEGATISGIELEWHQNLGSLWSALSNFKTGGNITWMQSEVNLNEEQKGVQTNSDRPLQGQSPYVVNLYLFYDNYRTDSQFGILFNQLGKRISGVGTLGDDDYYELPIPQLDMTFSQKFWEYYKVGLKAKNILAYPAIEKQEGNETRFKERPREYSMSLSASF